MIKLKRSSDNDMCIVNCMLMLSIVLLFLRFENIRTYLFISLEPLYISTEQETQIVQFHLARNIVQFYFYTLNVECFNAI